VGALRAVGAVFGAAASFDGDELAGLDTVWRVELAMDGLGFVEQFGERRAVDGRDFVA
jgi:hypothetical protein